MLAYDELRVVGDPLEERVLDAREQYFAEQAESILRMSRRVALRSQHSFFVSAAAVAVSLVLSAIASRGAGS